MTTIDSISPAKYWRESQNWSDLLGQTGKVIVATEIQLGLPELEDSTPYWLVLVKLDNKNRKLQLQLFIGSSGHTYKENDRVRCVLRRFSSPGNGLIHYGIKVLPSEI
jgi:uncharacterized OB-fold protein